MRKIPQKNYIILVVLLVVTIFLTLFLSNIYLSKNSLASDFYNYCNKIKTEEFDEFIVENPDSIIYISDKNDLTLEKFEKNFKTKIESLNIKDKLVFIDKSEIDDKFIKHIKKNYKINISIEKAPVILIIVDGEFIKSIQINQYTNVNEFIDYEAFE